MSSEAPAMTANTRSTNINNSKSSSGMPGTVRDLNAYEWSQAVIDELQHIQVATPPIKDIGSAPLPGRMGDRTNTHAHIPHPKRSTQEPAEPNLKQQPGHSQRNTSTGQPETFQRPQVGTMESTATIDIVKQIPGGW